MNIEMEAPSRAMRTAVCPLDCADTCSLDIEVVNGRMTQVRGGTGNPLTRGRICAKVASGLEQQL